MIDWSDLEILVKEKIFLSEIAKIKGCSPHTVNKYIHKLGIEGVLSRSEKCKIRCQSKEFIESVSGERGNRIDLKCEWCGITYRKLKSTIQGNHTFCSRHCKAKWIGNKLKNDIDYKIRQSYLIISKGNKPPVFHKENHPKWKGGISKQNRGQDYNYCKWRKDVLKKYNFTCQICGIRGGKLSSHHIIGWSINEYLRYDLNNGICYCYECHMKIHGLNKTN